MSAIKLDINSTYEIISIKEVTTKFGKNYVMTDKDLNSYWSTNAINKYIKEKQVRNIPNNKSKTILKIRTHDYKSFITSEGKEITYLACELMKM